MTSTSRPAVTPRPPARPVQPDMQLLPRRHPAKPTAAIVHRDFLSLVWQPVHRLQEQRTLRVAPERHAALEAGQ